MTVPASVGGWFRCPASAWPLIVEGLAKPWPMEVAVADLRWFEDQAQGQRDGMPGYRKLMSRWGWGEYSVRALMRDEARWSVLRSVSAASPQRLRTPPREKADKVAETSADSPQSLRTCVDTRVVPDSDSDSDRLPCSPPHEGGGDLTLVAEVAGAVLASHPDLRRAMAGGEAWLVKRARRGERGWERLPAGVRVRTLVAGMRLAAARCTPAAPATSRPKPVKPTLELLDDWREIVAALPEMADHPSCPAAIRDDLDPAVRRAELRVL